MENVVWCSAQASSSLQLSSCIGLTLRDSGRETKMARQGAVLSIVALKRCLSDDLPER